MTITPTQVKGLEMMEAHKLMVNELKDLNAAHNAARAAKQEEHMDILRTLRDEYVALGGVPENLHPYVKSELGL